jgi:transcriptional regulator with GAF, ATPase, and Fis domain
MAQSAIMLREAEMPTSSAVFLDYGSRQRAVRPPSADPDCQVIVGGSEALRRVLYRVDQVASTKATVLLLGETGTGKGLIAREIHDRSPRRHRPFAVVDCGTLPPTLIESELFGRERGAFTGALTSQPGRFEVASGGTVFLDEIGDLPLDLQPKLLRVLQEGLVERLGSARTVRVDVRIIAATNRNLAEDVRCGRFRRDLYYRLNVFPITVPALREHPDDLPALVSHFVEHWGRRLGKPVERVGSGSIEALRQHDWPGNIRELENVIQRAIILSQDGVVDLSKFVGEQVNDVPSQTNLDRPRTLVDVERDHIQNILRQSVWRIEGDSGAARRLGLHPSTLRSRMLRLGIHRPAKAVQAEA